MKFVKLATCLIDQVSGYTWLECSLRIIAYYPSSSPVDFLLSLQPNFSTTTLVISYYDH